MNPCPAPITLRCCVSISTCHPVCPMCSINDAKKAAKGFGADSEATVDKLKSGSSSANWKKVRSQVDQQRFVDLLQRRVVASQTGGTDGQRRRSSSRANQNQANFGRPGFNTDLTLREGVPKTAHSAELSTGGKRAALAARRFEGSPSRGYLEGIQSHLKNDPWTKPTGLKRPAIVPPVTGSAATSPVSQPDGTRRLPKSTWAEDREIRLRRPGSPQGRGSARQFVEDPLGPNCMSPACKARRAAAKEKTMEFKVKQGARSAANTVKDTAAAQNVLQALNRFSQLVGPGKGELKTSIRVPHGVAALGHSGEAMDYNNAQSTSFFTAAFIGVTPTNRGIQTSGVEEDQEDRVFTFRVPAMAC